MDCGQSAGGSPSSSGRNDRPCMVVLHEERTLRVPAGQVVEGQVGDDIGRVPLERSHLAVAVHLRVEVGALALEHLPLVEAGGPVGGLVAEVPLAEDRRLVARRVQLPGDVGQRIVQVCADRGHAVHMVVAPPSRSGASGPATPSLHGSRTGGHFVPLARLPCKVPVRIAARLGSQMLFVQKQRSKRAPSSAIRSRLGVRLIRLS